MQIADVVFVTAKPNDLFSEDFQGVVQEFPERGIVRVTDGDGNTWDVDLDQCQIADDDDDHKSHKRRCGDDGADMERRPEGATEAGHGGLLGQSKKEYTASPMPSQPSSRLGGENEIRM